MTLVSLALVGAGKFGRNYIRTILGLPGMRLAAVASRNPETQALLPEGCEQTAQWRELLKRPDIDGILIAAPTALHAEMILACVEAGKPVLAEKPMTLTLSEAERVCEAAARSGALVQIDHIYLFNAGFRALLDALPRIGAIRCIESIGGNRGPFREDTPPRWDYGAHDLAMMLAALEAAGIRAAHERLEARRIAEERGSEGYGEIVEARFTYPGGVEARLEYGNIMQPKTRRFTVEGTLGTLRFDDLAETKATFSPTGGAAAPLPHHGPMPLDAALLRFAESLRNPASAEGDHLLGLGVVKLLESIDANLA